MSDADHLDHRPNISGELANRLRDMIAGGELQAGERINEVHLAERMGISRTPLREALTALATEGALYSVPRRGFFVQELSRREFEDIYPLRALLDPEALRLAGVPDKQRLRRLETINEQLRRNRRSADRIELDDRWHLLLIESCPNATLLELIRQFMRRTRRYEVAYIAKAANVKTACEEHRQIISALKRNDLSGACRALKRNLRSGMGPILDWLEHRRK